MKEKVLKKFADQTLGTTYKNEQYGTQEFLDNKKLVTFLTDVAGQEADLTKSGFDFLKEYYGLEQVANIMDEVTKQELLAIKNSSDPQTQQTLKIIAQALEVRDKRSGITTAESDDDYAWNFDNQKALEWLQSIDPQHHIG